MNIYPNPTKGNLTITLGNNYEDVKITLLNLAGQILSTLTYPNKKEFTIEINGTNGYYIIQIDTKTGKSAIIKVLKE